MRALSILVILSSALGGLASAQQASQTDWSGGDGVPGPVLAWGVAFDSALDSSWLSIPGRLALSSTAVDAPDGQRIAATRVGFGIHAADVDGDGDLDVVGTSEGDREVLWWSNGGGDPIVWTEAIIESALTGANGVYTGDFDLDGRLDVVVSAALGTDDLIWYRNEGGSPIGWTKYVIDGSFPSCFEVSVGDVNQDGRPDVLAGSWDGQAVCWFENAPGSPVSWTKHVVDPAFDGSHCVKMGDFDGDGDHDVVAVAGHADEVAWWRNDGGASIVWTKHTMATGFTGGRSVAVADIDRDGDLDVAGTCWTSDTTWWRNDGGNPVVWTEQTISVTTSGGHHVKIADVNGDGCPDVLVAAFLVNDVVWFENGGGDPIAWTERMVKNTFARPIEVDAADVDGDGALDVLAASYAGGGGFNWWAPTEFVNAGELTSSIVDTGTGLPTAKLDRTADVPVGTDLRWQVRSSDDATDLGAWSAEVTEPTVVGDLDRFVQYRVLLSTTDPDLSPVVDDVSISTPSVTYRNGTGVNPEVFESTSLPILGAGWTARVDGGSLGAVGASWVVGYDLPLDPGLPFGVGELLLDPGSTWLVGDVEDLTVGIASHHLSIPVDVALVGFRVFTQAFLEDVGGGGRLTNAIDLVLGQ